VKQPVDRSWVRSYPWASWLTPSGRLERGCSTQSSTLMPISAWPSMRPRTPRLAGERAARTIAGLQEAPEEQRHRRDHDLIGD
jgi:hypothetical protein